MPIIPAYPDNASSPSDSTSEPARSVRFGSHVSTEPPRSRSKPRHTRRSCAYKDTTGYLGLAGEALAKLALSDGGDSSHSTSKTKRSRTFKTSKTSQNHNSHSSGKRSGYISSRHTSSRFADQTRLSTTPIPPPPPPPPPIIDLSEGSSRFGPPPPSRTRPSTSTSPDPSISAPGTFMSRTKETSGSGTTIATKRHGVQTYMQVRRRGTGKPKTSRLDPDADF
ncbi:hypothetical protein I316_07056 [Kwoniella heveanensis BCC8398]|uniref:Uncharacterized protein n=1 Tax=Kwoniella heveanensis BCC8398 TaxID=1296120 RepID=A0A1B9GJK0_9TREE|nr:hypothetical protein I316_07056 [Kwoniella heveanensis BCC8398]